MLSKEGPLHVCMDSIVMLSCFLDSMEEGNFMHVVEAPEQGKEEDSLGRAGTSNITTHVLWEHL